MGAVILFRMARSMGRFAAAELRCVAGGWGKACHGGAGRKGNGQGGEAGGADGATGVAGVPGL